MNDQNDTDLQQALQLRQIEDELRTSYNRTFALMAHATTIRMEIVTELNKQVISTLATTTSAPYLVASPQPQLNAYAKTYVTPFPAVRVIQCQLPAYADTPLSVQNVWTIRFACGQGVSQNVQIRLPVSSTSAFNYQQPLWNRSGRFSGGSENNGRPQPDPDPGDEPDKVRRNREIDSKRQGEF